MSETKRDYEIGYGKPPVGRRFQKGQSGNPRGPHPTRGLRSTAPVDALGERPFYPLTIWPAPPPSCQRSETQGLSVARNNSAARNISVRNRPAVGNRATARNSCSRRAAPP